MAVNLEMESDYYSLDVFSMTNPALGSLVISSFLSGFCETAPAGSEHPLLFLPVPVILSEDILSTFTGTNTQTGFFSWLSQNQNIKLNISKKIVSTKNITRDALIFGVKHNLISVTSDYRFIAGNKAINLFSKKGYKKFYPSPEIALMFERSKVFGKWLGQVNSTEHTYIGLGLYEPLEH